MIWVWYNVAPIICCIAAAVLAFNHIDGWGWFLLVAVLAGVSPGGSDDECSCSRDNNKSQEKST